MYIIKLTPYYFKKRERRELFLSIVGGGRLGEVCDQSIGLHVLEFVHIVQTLECSDTATKVEVFLR